MRLGGPATLPPVWPGFLDCVVGSLRGAEKPDGRADRAASEQDTEVWQGLPRQPAALALTLHLTEASGHGVPAGVLNATPGMSAGAPRVKPSRRLGPEFVGTDGTIGLTSALQ